MCDGGVSSTTGGGSTNWRSAAPRSGAPRSTAPRSAGATPEGARSAVRMTGVVEPAWSGADVRWTRDIVGWDNGAPRPRRTGAANEPDVGVAVVGGIGPSAASRCSATTSADDAPWEPGTTGKAESDSACGGSGSIGSPRSSAWASSAPTGACSGSDGPGAGDAWPGGSDGPEAGDAWPGGSALGPGAGAGADHVSAGRDGSSTCRWIGVVPAAVPGPALTTRGMLRSAAPGGASGCTADSGPDASGASADSDGAGDRWSESAESALADPSAGWADRGRGSGRAVGSTSRDTVATAGIVGSGAGRSAGSAGARVQPSAPSTGCSWSG